MGLFDDFAKYRIVLVTGPQRSGTTICSRIVAAETGHAHVDERDYGVKGVAPWRTLIRVGKGLVIQCPSMARYVHEYGQDESLAVIWMRRPLEEIYASQERIGWDKEPDELFKYKNQDVIKVENGTPIAIIKNKFWRAVQRPAIKNAFEICYDSLSYSSLWYDKHTEFEARQWKVGEPIDNKNLM